MAKKKSSENNEDYLIIFLFFVIAVIIAPLAILLYAVYLKSKKLEDFLNENNNVWLSLEEKQEFVENYQIYSETVRMINWAHHLAEQHHVSINQDGSYSRRSKIGKEINAILEREEPIHDSLKQRLCELSAAPEKTYRKIIFNLSFLHSAKYALIFWVISFAAAYFSNDQQVLKISFFYSGAISIGCMLVFFFLQKKKLKNELAAKGIAEPPEVDINNVNSY